MIRRSDEKETVRKPAPFNGAGEITVRNLLGGGAFTEDELRKVYYDNAKHVYFD